MGLGFWVRTLFVSVDPGIKLGVRVRVRVRVRVIMRSHAELIIRH